MGLIRKAFLLVLFGLAARHTFRIVLKLGFHKVVYNHSPGPCHLVDGIVHGSEDIQVLSNGIAIITSGLRDLANPSDGRRGAFYLFDFNDPKAGVTKLPLVGCEVENPHGIGIWEEPDNDKMILFVVNHAADEERVEKLEFNQNSKTLTCIKSITDPSFIWPNDVVATGPDSFYVTNSFGSNNNLMKLVEVLFILHRGTLVYYNGLKGQVIADNFAVPNGVNLSPDGRFLYVASLFDERLEIFYREEDNNLRWKEGIKLNTFPDNIDVHKDTGDLWIGNHAITYKTAAHDADHTSPSPAQVLRLRMSEGNVTHIEEVFARDDMDIYGSSVAVYYKGAMLVGSVYHKLMYCQVLDLQ